MLTKIQKKQLDEITSFLSLEQKLSQMFIVGYYDLEIDRQLLDWVNNFLGGIIFFKDNISSPKQLSKLISNLQILSSLGMFISVDQEGGLVERIPDLTQIPTPMALASTLNQDDISRANDLMASELKIFGVNLNYTPVVDVNTNPDNPIIGIRSFGDDPSIVSANALKVIESMRRYNIIPVAKHFPGHGSVDIDSHKMLPSINITYNDLCKDHLFPFQELIYDDIEMIMIAHLAIKQITDDETIPATLSEGVVRDLLINKMSYEGVIISDDMNMRAITNAFTRRNAAILALKAGIDLLLYRNYRDARVAYNYLLSEVKSGNISEERIDYSVKKILALKMKYSIFKSNYCFDEDKIETDVKNNQSIDLSDDLFNRSITIYKSSEYDDSSTKLIISVDREKLIHYKSEDELSLGSLITDADELKISINPTNEEMKNVLSSIDKYDELIIIAYNAKFNRNQMSLIKELIKIKPAYILAAGSPYDVISFSDAKLLALSYGYSNGAIKAFNSLLKGEIKGNKNLPVNLLL